MWYGPLRMGTVQVTHFLAKIHGFSFACARACTLKSYSDITKKGVEICEAESCRKMMASSIHSFHMFNTLS